MINEWNELKEWLIEEIKDKPSYGISYYSIYLNVALDKMKQLENDRYCKSLTEAGY